MLEHLTEQENETINTAALLHDIGKISVPKKILNNPNRLTDEEFEKIKKHPVMGYNMLKFIPGLKEVAKIVRHHHENWDGTGYPDKLAGNDIPLGARVVAITDSYHAMTSDRPYRKGMPKEKAIQILKEGAGTQWDPELVEKFVSFISNK